MRWLSIITLAACGSSDPATPKDADGSDAAPCPTPNVTGELIDWDSSTTDFMGIADATVSLEGFTGDPTPPNGRWGFCASGGPFPIVVEAPGTYVDAVGYIEADALRGRAISLRTFTAARAASFYTERSLAYDPALAHVLVFQSGDREELTLDRAHAETQSGNDEDADGFFMWDPGESGRYVLFPNVAVDQATATLGGDPSGGPHTIPLAAGKLTLAVIHHDFL
jgi:hypothetical protein